VSVQEVIENAIGRENARQFPTQVRAAVDAVQELIDNAVDTIVDAARDQGIEEGAVRRILTEAGLIETDRPRAAVAPASGLPSDGSTDPAALRRDIDLLMRMARDQGLMP